MIIRFSSLGDILLTTPLIRTLKKQNPDIQIDFLIKQKYEAAIKFNSNLNKIFLWEESGTLIPLNEYALIIDLQNNLRSRKLLTNVNTEVVRFKKKSLQKFLLVKLKINLLKNENKIPSRYASSIPIKLDEHGLDFFLPAGFPVEGKNPKLIGISPGSRHFTKRYPTEYFIQLGKILLENGFEIALIGGKEDKFLCDKIAKEIPAAHNLCSDDDLFQTAAAIKKCSAVVCNDSGLMHLASALQVPLIAIFGSTVEEFGFFPYNCKNIIMENKHLNCRPCSHIGKNHCPKGHFNCMKEILPQAIYENIKTLLS